VISAQRHEAPAFLIGDQPIEHGARVRAAVDVVTKGDE
jgi:hypothetical protein